MLPIYLVGAVAGVLLVERTQKHINRRAGVGIEPGSVSQPQVTPQHGSIVCCEIYHSVWHTGIWTDDGIVELAGSGLVRLISPTRFLAQRSGAQIYVLSASDGRVLANPELAQRALSEVFTYRAYHLLDNNCHRFVAHMLDASDAQDIVWFHELNGLIHRHYGDTLAYLPIGHIDVK